MVVLDSGRDALVPYTGLSLCLCLLFPSPPHTCSMVLYLSGASAWDLCCVLALPGATDGASDDCPLLASACGDVGRRRVHHAPLL